MIKLIIIVGALFFLVSALMAGSVMTKQIPNGGYVKTFYGTGYIVLASTRVGQAAVAGTTGQCIGILCGVTYSN